MREVRTKKGFTLIEIAVVITVIGILAAIVTISYGAWRTKVAADAIKIDLSAIKVVMEDAKNFNNGYPEDIPASFIAGENNTMSYIMGDKKNYCIEARSTVVTGLYYFATSEGGGQVLEGTCAGGEGSTPDETILVYDTTMDNCNGSVQLPISSSKDGSVDWGDGSSDSPANVNHVYATPGVYVVSYDGPISQFYTTTTPTGPIKRPGADCLKEVRQWGKDVKPSLVNFRGSRNLTRVAAIPAGVVSMSKLFYGAINFNQNINNWDTSKISSMDSAFRGASSFNQPLNNWDTSNVVNMSSMFESASVFNQPLNNWDTSSATSMAAMFRGAKEFNQPLNNWDTSSVTTISDIFKGASSFDRNINNWNTSKITGMSGAFQGAKEFNQPLNNWDTSNVVNMSSMFESASVFNQPLNNWDTSSATSMAAMFRGAKEFNQPLNNWDTSSVTTTVAMFQGAHMFNQPIGNWDVSNVVKTAGTANNTGMFAGAKSFNQDLNGWDVSSMSTMREMFSNSGFNGDISNWDTSSVTTMEKMFSGASSFNRDIGGWNAAAVTDMRFMFNKATSFNQDLSGWSVGNVSRYDAFDYQTTSWTKPKPNFQ